MFISETHLPQMLPCQAYTEQKPFDCEVATLFKPGWHCVASLFDLPKEGSFWTTQLLDHPVILWRQEGEVHAFVNVCAHRFSKLTDSQCGHMDRLKCQYHGWEYDTHGDTKRIPDAQSFRPLKRGQLGLTKLRCERVGQLIFVTLNPDAVSLRDYLGAGYELCQQIFSSSYRPVLACRRDNHANWKVSLENSLEGYHLNEVHSKTFGQWPDAQFCHHELHDSGHSSLRVGQQPESHLARLGRAALRLAGGNDDLSYHQFHCYPNLVFAKFGVFSWMEAVYPISPSDSFDTWRFFSNGGNPNTLRGRLATAAMRQWGRRWFKRVITEDETVFPDIQAGLASPVHPGTGLVSVREERVVHFQKYILERTQSAGESSEEYADTNSTPEWTPCS